MPVVAYKKMTLNVRHVQARRIDCEFCRQPFTYLTDDTESVGVTGVPVMSSDDRMRKSATKKAEKALERHANAAERGEAICPRCRRYQPWMVKSSLTTNLGCGGCCGLLVVGGVGGLASAAMHWFDSPTTGFTVMGVGGLLIGLAIGKAIALKSGRQDSGEERSMTDDEFRALVKGSMDRDEDPVSSWFFDVADEPPADHAFVSLGYLDLVDPPLPLPEWKA